MTGRFDLSRDVLASGLLSPHVEAARAAGLIAPLPDDEREANRRATLASHPEGEDLHVFAFGSLMWNPACDVAEAVPATVRGWHRRFNLWLHLGRGAADFPGLALGLERGGSCRGLALRIEAAKVDSETRLIWRREMFAGAYVPIWVGADLGDRTEPAVSFAIDPGYVRYAHRVPFEVQARHIGRAEGPLGPCIDYLERTVETLQRIGRRRGPMHDLLRAAREERRRHSGAAAARR